MSILQHDIDLVQNPAYGAVLLSAFAVGYRDKHIEKDSPPLVYLFVALPMLLHADILTVIKTTRLSLRKFAEKFTTGELARLTLRSVEIMLSAGLIRLDIKTARAIPLDGFGHHGRGDLPEAFELAARLGGWFSELSLFEVGSILKVTF